MTNDSSTTVSTHRLTYVEALERVMSLADFERSRHSPGHAGFHLQRMELMMDRLGRPHQGIATVHIAGTKGKGSTAAMVTSILAAQGYAVGLYTSPHLHSAVERIRVGLTPIERGDFAALVHRTWPVVEWVSKHGGHGGVSTFEALTALAFVHFQDVGADFQVIEVGLGGRLDSTNVVSPDVCAITSISLDHVATLGDTLQKIAYEKAGIIKRGVPVVVAPQPREAMTVIRETAARQEAPFVRVDERMSWSNGDKGDRHIEGQSFRLQGLLAEYDLWMPLLGSHQLENASAAIAAVETLISKGVAVSGDSIGRGLREVRWPGRLEVLSRKGKLVAVDGAHNQYSMRRLVEALRDHFSWRRLVVVFGALGGHSASPMLAELAELSPAIIAARSRHPRSTPSDIIAKAAAEQGLPVLSQTEDISEATQRALELAGDGDMVLGTGSLSVAAEIIEEVRGVTPEMYPYIKPPVVT